MSEWIITTAITLGIGVITYFLKRTMSQVDKHGEEIRRIDSEIYGRNGRRFTQTFQTRTTKPMRESFLKGTGRRCWKARRFYGRRNCLIMI